MSYENPRINMLGGALDGIMAMSQGNPGAVTVLTRIMEKGPSIDPDCAFGPFGGMIALDTLDVYGSRIWQFYKDVCAQDLTAMLGLMRCVQMGILPESHLIAAIDGERKPEGWIQDNLNKLREQLPAFGAATV
jgi:hypothetical protein